MATNKILRHINSLRLQIRTCRNESNCSSAFLTAISQKHVNQSFSIPHVLTKCRYTQSIKNSSELRSTDGLCWNCRKNVQNSKFFCPSCGAALPVEKSENYFTLFDLQTDFIISLPDLQQKFKELQKLLHPDKFSLKSATEQEVSQSVSSKLNKAYFCLAKPLSRGLYMLKLQG
uniref:J domain-containing protein n=1 Tax=Ciona savignyi TaxID=51511 RepID=H2ZBV2_CIOSA